MSSIFSGRRITLNRFCIRVGFNPDLLTERQKMVLKQSYHEKRQINFPTEKEVLILLNKEKDGFIEELFEEVKR